MKSTQKNNKKKQTRLSEKKSSLESPSSFDSVIESIETENPKIGKYGATLKSTIRKLRDKCDNNHSGDFIKVVNDFENTYGCIRKVTKNDKTLKSNISHIVGVFRRYVPRLTNLVSNEAMRFWNQQITNLDKSIRSGDPENDSGEDISWKSLTWKKVVNAKKQIPIGSFERLAIDVYTSPGVPPRRGEWAHVIVYEDEDPPERPPEQNWIYLPAKGATGAFVEFNAFKTHKTVNSQRINIPLELTDSLRETMFVNNLTFPSNIFGFDNFNPQTQSNKFNSLLMRALNTALDRTDIKRPANMFRHLYLTDVFHNRLHKMSDEDLKTILKNMATSLEQAMYTYRIVVKGKDEDEYKSTGGGKENNSIKSKLQTLNSILKDLDPSYQK
jgi:hypothetical protein